MEKELTYRYSKTHDLLNAWTHGFGILLFLILGPIMIYKSALSPHNDVVIGAIIFFCSLLLVYIFSTLYHSVHTVKLNALFRKLDHIAIYFLIGGSYTAFILRFYNEPNGHYFLAVHWGIILCGVIFKLFFTGKYELLSTGLYLLLGWMVIFIYKDMTANIPDFSMHMIMWGGASYTIGVLFYAISKIPYNHAIWHLFVLGGSICHYISFYASL